MKLAFRPSVGTGLTKKAEPAVWPVWPVSWATPPPGRVATPLAVQLPVAGAGSAPVPVPVSGSSMAPWPASPVTS